MIPFARNRRPARLVMLLLVRDEADIVEQTLRFHLERGVDFIVATDNGSVDGTVEILEEYRRRGVLDLQHEASQDYDQRTWVTRMMRRARDEFAAQWLFSCDADEFWRPSRGDLKDAVAEARGSVIRVPVVNMMGRRASGDRPPSEYVPVAKPRDFGRTPRRAFMQLPPPGTDNMPHAWILGYQPGKVMARADCVESFEMGNHDVRTRRPVWRSASGVASIRHYPVRGRAQFETKVVLAGRAFEKNPHVRNDSTGWHVRRWYEFYKAGRLDEEYARQVISDEAQLEGLIRRGFVSSGESFGCPPVP